jgi:hypothetical protein
MATTEQLLSNILTELKGIRAELTKGGGKAEARSSAPAASGGAVANDRELDSEYGNPAVRKDPKRWNADVNGSYAGCNFSECPADYLDCLADLFDWMGDKDDEDGKQYNGKPASIYKRKDAARARGWSQRKRNGWQPPAKQQRQSEESGDVGGNPEITDSDIPF